MTGSGGFLELVLAVVKTPCADALLFVFLCFGAILKDYFAAI
jgi:hypothetical protein